MFLKIWVYFCLTLFLPAMGRISPYISVTWQQPVGIGLTQKEANISSNLGQDYFYLYSEVRDLTNKHGCESFIGSKRPALD